MREKAEGRSFGGCRPNLEAIDYFDNISDVDKKKRVEF
jgi:hypothetical protein